MNAGPKTRQLMLNMDPAIACVVRRYGRPVGSVVLATFLLASACSETLNAGSTVEHGPLPVDERNPVILVGDGAIDNWFGVYAMLLADGPGPRLAGIVVNASKPWPDLDKNVSDWSALVDAAKRSGLQGIPVPIRSDSSPLVRPADGNPDSTQHHGSPGALFIAKTAQEMGRPYRPVAVVNGGALTDVADAYLVDPTIADRMVVVASLGSVSATGAGMTGPNGDLDPWADAIVAQRLKYVQISAFYDQSKDVPADMAAQLPRNPLGQWIAEKRTGLWGYEGAADQVAIIAVGIPQFPLSVERMSAATTVAADATSGPNLVPNSAGKVWVVSEIAFSVPSACLWSLLGETQ
jgi:hypothetical protein